MRGCCRKSTKKLVWFAIVVYNMSFKSSKKHIWSMQVCYESCSNYSCQKLYDVAFPVNINPSHLNIILNMLTHGWKLEWRMDGGATIGTKGSIVYK